MEPTEIIASDPSRTAKAPTDVLRLAVAAGSLLLIVVVALLFDEAVVGFLADLARGLQALPAWLVTGIVVAGQLLGLIVIGAGLVVTLVQQRWHLLATMAAASAVAAGLTVVLRPLVDYIEPAVADVASTYALVPPDRVASAIGLTLMTAVVTSSAPWINRRWRQLGWALVISTTLTRLLGAPVGLDTLTALLAGWTAGAAAIVAMGAPSRRPTGASIAAGLAAVGVPLARLEQASLDARGSTPYFGTGVDGRRLFVKALGTDERSADLLFRLYRRVQPRDLGDERPFSSLRRAVEHEALVALAARDLGVCTPRVVAVATADPNGYVLAYEAIAGRSLDRLEPEEVTDEVLAGVWRELVQLRQHRIAHRDLRLANVFLAEDGVAWIIDFGFSELAASDLLLATDLAELIASSSTKVGAARAVAAAHVAVGPEAVASSLDRLRPAFLAGATRSAMQADPQLLVDVRALISSAGTTP